jgi:uncharacterized protein (TIGR02246 family)
MNVEADKAAIEKMSAHWLEAMNQGGEAGADGYAGFVTEDAVFLPPNAERIDGRAGVRDAMLEFTTSDDFSISWRPTRIEILDDGGLALAIGEYQYSLRDPEGNLVSDKGKYFEKLTKQADGSWLCSVGMWNSDLPSTG